MEISDYLEEMKQELFAELAGMSTEGSAEGELVVEDASSLLSDMGANDGDISAFVETFKGGGSEPPLALNDAASEAFSAEIEEITAQQA